MLRVAKVMLVVACFCCTMAVAADWPNFLGPTRNGLAPDTGINKNWAAKPPQELWRVPMHDDGFAGPCVADGKVFIIDHEGAQDIVRAFGFGDGKQVWEFAYPDTDKPNYGFGRSTPVFSDGKLYVAGRLGQLLCLEAATGKPVWGKNLMRDFQGQKPQWDYSGSPLIDGDRLIICCGGPASVACLDKNTGNPIWTGGNQDAAGYTSPIPATILGQKQYVVTTGSYVIGVDAATGKLAWAVPWENKCKVNASQPMVEGDYVFITSGYGIGCALYQITANGPVERWRSRDISAHFSSPIYYGGYLYSNSDPGNLVCMSPATGEVAWKQGGFEKGGLVIVDGVIIALTGRDGDLVMATAQATGYQELGRLKAPLGGQSWTAPIVADGKLLIRNKSALACLDLK
ncbi:MAG: PQQ-binding-like beta-propeller repeat protein [Armatimonadia bacterium]